MCVHGSGRLRPGELAMKAGMEGVKAAHFPVGAAPSRVYGGYSSVSDDLAQELAHGVMWRLDEWKM